MSYCFPRICKLESEMANYHDPHTHTHIDQCMPLTLGKSHSSQLRGPTQLQRNYFRELHSLWRNVDNLKSAISPERFITVEMSGKRKHFVAVLLTRSPQFQSAHNNNLNSLLVLI